MRRLHCSSCRTPVPARTRSHEPCPACAAPLTQETRCAWCLGWQTEPVCAACTAEILPAQDFGAARLLVDGGVDRFALPERVRGLPRNQYVALSNRFDAEWSALQVRVEEARFVQAALVTPGLVDPIETMLLSLVPLRPDALAEMTARAGDESDDSDARLAAIERASPVHATQVMAAIARVHRGVDARETVRTVMSALHAEPAIAGEAAVAVLRGEARGWLRLESYERARWAMAAEALHDHPQLAPWGAVILARAGEHAGARLDPEERARLARRRESSRPKLEAALAARDPDLRLAAALALDDEATLAPFLDGSDALAAGRVRRALAGLGAARLQEELRSGSTERRRELLRHVKRPLDAGWLEALLAALDRDPVLRDEGLRLLTEIRHATSPYAERLAAWIEGAPLDAGSKLELLSWASHPREDRPYAPPHEGPELRPFVDAVTRALLAPDAQLLDRHRMEHQRWLHLVDPAAARPVVDAWLAGPETAAAIIEQAIELHGRLNGYDMPPDDRAWRHLLDAFDRDPAAVAEPLGAALERRRGLSGREAVVESLWARMKTPSIASHAATALRGYRHEVEELRLREPLESPWHAGRGAIYVRTAGESDPLDLPAIVRRALESGGDDLDLAELVRAVEALVTPRISARTCTMMCAVANVASGVVGRFRDDPREPRALAGVEALRSAWRSLEPRVRDASPIDEREARIDHLVEQVETELRLAAEAEERVAEAERRAAERAEAEARRAAEAAAREAAARQAEDEARRAADARAAAALAAVRATPGEGQGIDREPLLPEQPLPTLADYAGFIRAMSAGGDVMALFRAKGMTPEAWAGCAAAWTQVLITRPHVGMRFAELMSERSPL